jgi:hypothetical protein
MADNERDDFPTNGAIHPTPTGQTPTPTSTGSGSILTLLTIGTSVMFFFMLMVLAFHEIPASNKDLFNVLLGVLGTAWGGSIIGFFFGSSSSNKLKDDIISRMSR